MLRRMTMLAPAVLALAGCNQARTDIRQKAADVTAAVFNASGDARVGQRVEPRFCKLDTAVISRPVGDKVVDGSLWAVADEQSAVPPDLRRGLEANGFRVGIVTGELPGDVVEAFHPPPPQVDAQWVHIAIPDGEQAPQVLGEAVDSVTLFLTHEGKVDGRDYRAALARLLLTPRQVGLHDVEVRIVPEIQHGARQRTIGALEGAGSFAPQEFAIKEAQQAELLRELTAHITLKPGQTLVIGCRPAQVRTLGAFLFLQPEPKSDRMLQKVLLIQAGRNNDGTPPLKVVEELVDAGAPEPAAAGSVPTPARAARPDSR